METQTPFTWRETSPGIYKRELDECEKFYRLCTRSESGCFPVTSSASFTVNTNARDSSKIKDAFRKAWLTLRYRHPTLASRVEHDAQTGQWLRVYNVDEDKEDQKTFSVHYASDALEWFNRDAPDFEHASVYLVQSQTGNDSPWAVFLRCPHDITDGIGVLQLLDQLFMYAAKALEQGSEYAMPTWGYEGVCLSPCLRAAAGIPDTLSSSQSQRLDDIKARNAALYNHKRLLGLPSSRSSSYPSGRRERIPFPLSENTTREILTRCKRIGTGVSVTHVFMAALALVLAQFQLPRDTKEDAREFRYVNHSMINLRPYCQPPYNGPDHAAAAYHTISAQALAIDVDVNATIPPSSPPDLAQAVCKVRDFFKETFSDTNSRSDKISFACETFKSITPAPGVDIHAVSETPFFPVPLSSLGNVSRIVARRHGAIQVQHVWAASEPIGAGVALFLGTWEGNLELSAVFDTRYHEREVVRVFLESIVRCVCDGLDVV